MVHAAAVSPAGGGRPAGPPLVCVSALCLRYGDRRVLDGVSFDPSRCEFLAFPRPSGDGKSTALACLSRINGAARGVCIAGSVRLDGQDGHAAGIYPPVLRRRSGRVAQKSDPIPVRVWENVAVGPRMRGPFVLRADLSARGATCLRRAGLWGGVKDALCTVLLARRFPSARNSGCGSRGRSAPSPTFA